MTDFPKTLFFNALFSVIVYWMVGLEPTAGAFFIYLLVIFLTSFISESLAIAVSVMTGDAQSAAGIIPVFIILAVLFGGFFIGASELDGWIAWAKWLSFVFYAFNALGKNEFQNRVFDNAEIQAANDQALANFNDLSVWENVAALCGLMVVFRLTGYLFLHYLRGPKFLKF